VSATTAETMRQTDDNFAAWGDGKEWMGVAFSRAITVRRDAVHAADPTALAGLEGAQKPGWGGYNYVDLSHAVDVMESGLATVNFAHALNPGFITSDGMQRRICIASGARFSKALAGSSFGIRIGNLWASRRLRAEGIALFSRLTTWGRRAAD
jgi:hypothetical protein